MINAKDEFVEHALCEGMPEVLCAKLTCGYDWDEDNKSMRLNVGFTASGLDNFLQTIDFDYDSGYGGQLLFGIIWYKDGTFSQRGEYDGSEWWEHVTVPEIPEELK